MCMACGWLILSLDVFNRIIVFRYKKTAFNLKIMSESFDS